MVIMYVDRTLTSTAVHTFIMPWEILMCHILCRCIALIVYYFGLPIRRCNTNRV